MSTDNRLGNIGNILSGGASRPRLVPNLPAEPAGPAGAGEEPAAGGKAPRRASEAASRSAASPSPVRRKKPAAHRESVHRVPVRLDADLRERLDLAARARESSLSEIAFDAIEEAHGAGALQQLVEVDHQASARPARRPAGPLFQRPEGRTTAQPAVMTEFRFTASDLGVLDDLVDETGASSRSQLIKAALRRHLSRSS